MAVSVVLAAYNGEKYLSQQIDSIVSQFEEGDELIISLDPSTDQSQKMIKSFCKEDGRIRLVNGPGKGLISNFENGLKYVRNDYVFLSDQDDVWMKDKIRKVVASFDSDTMIVMHDAIITDGNLQSTGKSIYQVRNVRTGIWKNMIQNSYRGCCMAFRKELLDVVLPFPQKLPMHDQLIGITGELMGKVKLIDDQLILYRRHEDNASEMKHAGVMTMLKWRLQIIKAYFLIRQRIQNRKDK